MAQIQTAYALVDWHNLEGYFDFRFSTNPRKYLPDAILRLQRQVSRALQSLGGGERYRVTTRIYHGWHRDRDTMPIRRDFEAFANDASMARRFAGVSFTPGFQFGNELICY